MAGSIPKLSPRYRPSHKSAAERFGLSFEENAFVVAFCGKGRYNPERAGEVCGLTSERAWSLYTSSKIRRAIDSRLKARTMSAAAIQAELSDIGASSPGDRERVKALEILAKVKGLGKDRASVLLEAVLLQELRGQREKRELAEGSVRLIGSGNTSAPIDISPVRAEDALAEGSEVRAAAREREALRKAAASSVNPPPDGPLLSPETQLALPLAAPQPLQEVEEDSIAIPSPASKLSTR